MKQRLQTSTPPQHLPLQARGALIGCTAFRAQLRGTLIGYSAFRAQPTRHFDWPHNLPRLGVLIGCDGPEAAT